MTAVAVTTRGAGAGDVWPGVQKRVQHDIAALRPQTIGYPPRQSRLVGRVRGTTRWPGQGGSARRRRLPPCARYEKRLPSIPPGYARQPLNMVSGRRAPARETMRPLQPLPASLIGGGYPPMQAVSGLRSRSPERTEPTPLLNHETSDHLLSLVIAMCRGPPPRHQCA
jgi:hypothetical protein